MPYTLELLSGATHRQMCSQLIASKTFSWATIYKFARILAEITIRKSQAFIFLFFFCFTSQSYSEPSTTIKKLMNEPLTMFDWGVYQLEKYFETYPFDDLGLERSTENALVGLIKSKMLYDWDNNRLKIHFLIGLKEENFEKAKDICYKVTQKIRKSFVFDNYGLKDFAGLSKFFKHTRFNSYKNQKNRINTINEIEKVIIQLNKRVHYFGISLNN